MRINSKVLIIAGSDSSGGAGIQADIKTVSSLGSYAMTAVTAVTSQNTTGVLSIFSVSPAEISKQIEFTSKDIKPDAIKIGMLGNAKAINAVIKSVSKIKVNKIILDPVMVAKGGARLIDNSSIKIRFQSLMSQMKTILKLPSKNLKNQINSVQSKLDHNHELIKKKIEENNYCLDIKNIHD